MKAAGGQAVQLGIAAVPQHQALARVVDGQALGHVAESDVEMAVALHQRGIDRGLGLARAPVLGDVGVRGDEAAAGGRMDVDLQDRAVGTRALDPVGLVASRARDALADLLLDVARPVLAAFGAVAQEGGEGRAASAELLGIADELEAALIDELELELVVEDGDALIEALERGVEHQ